MSQKKGPTAAFIEVMLKEHPVATALVVLFIVSFTLTNPATLGTFIGGSIGLLYAGYVLFEQLLPWINRKGRGLLGMPTPEQAAEIRRHNDERRRQERLLAHVRKLEEQLERKVQETWSACWQEVFLQQGDEDNHLDVRWSYFPMLQSERQLEVLVARILSKDKAFGLIENYEAKVDVVRKALLKKYAKEIEVFLNEPTRREEIIRAEDEWEYRVSLGLEIRNRKAEGKPLFNDDGKLMVVVALPDGMYTVKPWWEVTDEDDVVENRELQ